MRLFRRAIAIGTMIVFVLIISALAFWVGGGFIEAKNVSKVFLSQSRFAQLQWFLMLYHQEHGAFPPTKYQAAADGPVHSWRVLLLPHISASCKELYSEYDFSETWNSPKNLAVARSLRRFAHGFNMDRSMADNEIANYLAIGDGDQWPSENPLKARLITKGNDRFLLVEYPDSKIRWMEPEY